MRTDFLSSVVSLLLLVAGCSRATDPTQAVSTTVRWQIPSAVAPSASLIHELAATDSIYFVGGGLDIAAHRASDGALLWKRGGVPTRPPKALGDSIVVVLTAGGSVAMRQRDGTVLWQTARVGTESSVIPIAAGVAGMFADYDGNLYGINLITGATRRLATMSQLTDGPGAIWGLTLLGDTVVVLSQRADSPIRGAMWLSHVLLADGRIVRSAAIPTLPNETASTAPMTLTASGALVGQFAGGLAAIDARSGARRWTLPAINTGARFALRDGKVYAGTGDGTILVFDAETGTEIRRIERLSASIQDVFPCRDGIVFTSGGLYIVNDVAGAKAVTLAPITGDGGFLDLVRNSTTVFSSAPSRDIAVACS